MPYHPEKANDENTRRTPPDEAATCRELWAAWPHGVLMGTGRDHARLAALVEDGFVEAYDDADLGTDYRLHPDWGERRSGLTVAFGEQAGLN